MLTLQGFSINFQKMIYMFYVYNQTYNNSVWQRRKEKKWRGWAQGGGPPQQLSSRQPWTTLSRGSRCIAWCHFPWFCYFLCCFCLRCRSCHCCHLLRLWFLLLLLLLLLYMLPFVQSNHTVSGVMLLNANGLAIKSTLDNTSTVQVEESSNCCTFSNTISHVCISCFVVPFQIQI